MDLVFVPSARLSLTCRIASMTFLLQRGRGAYTPANVAGGAPSQLPPPTGPRSAPKHLTPKGQGQGRSILMQQADCMPELGLEIQRSRGCFLA
jgi:hypothetical protein